MWGKVASELARVRERVWVSGLVDAAPALAVYDGDGFFGGRIFFFYTK